MHILEIPSFFPPAGGLFCLDQAKALQTLGHEVRILSNVQLGATIQPKEFLTLPYSRYEHDMDGVTVYQSYQRGIPKMTRYNVGHWTKIVCSMFHDYEKKYGKPDILHAHCAKWAGYAAMLIGENHHIPYVITEHMPLFNLMKEFGKAPSDAWQIPLLCKAYHQANKVLPVAREIVEDTACYYGKDYNWTELSNTIDTNFFTFRNRPSLEGRNFKFCCTAIYDPRKGYDILFSAFRKLRKEGMPVELHIAGSGTNSNSCLSQLSENMFSYGHMNKSGIRELLYQCDALVLASRSEVQPLSLLEAMSTGIPVIATECIPQSLRIDGYCRIVPIDDVDAFAEAMKLTINHYPTNGQDLSEKVYHMASPIVIGKKLEAIFNEIIA